MKHIIILFLALSLVACSKNDSLLVGDNNAGINGSITRFAIQGNYLYAIDFNYLKTFSLADNDNPELIGSVKVGYGLETIFIYDNYIYLGATDGVYVMSILNPGQPVQLQKVVHQISCDPVVVQGNYAYSTQRTNTIGCGTWWNTSLLAVYDVSNPLQATLVTDIPMESPYGLAVEGNWLFVCDPGQGGLLVFNITDPSNPVYATTKQINEPRDIILLGTYMIVVTKTKFELYNYENPLNIYLISALNIS